VFPQSPAVQGFPASRDPGVRAAREPGVHDVLHRWTFHGIRHQNGALVGDRDRSLLGDLRRDLLPASEQGGRANHAY